MPSSQNGSSDATLENGDPKLEEQRTRDEMLRNALTNTQSIPSDIFERVYLQPKNQVAGQLRKTFANPTPLALLGIGVGLTPLACELMNWRGASGFGVATTTASIWYGGMLLILAGAGEFILGNTFPFLVFMGYGCHFLTYATTFIPYYNAINFFDAPGQTGQLTPTFEASYAYYPVALLVLSLVFMLGSIRTNVVFLLIFNFASIGFALGTVAFFKLAEGDMVLGNRLVVGLGGCFFGGSMCAWYLLIAEMIIIMELPLPDLPVGDLTRIVKARPRTGDRWAKQQ